MNDPIEECGRILQEEIDREVIVRIIAAARESSPVMIANEIANVQPMPADVFNVFRDASMNEADLIAQGYEPIDPTTRLMWVKK